MNDDFIFHAIVDFMASWNRFKSSNITFSHEWSSSCYGNADEISPTKSYEFKRDYQNITEVILIENLVEL